MPVFSGVPIAANLGIANANRTAARGGALIGFDISELLAGFADNYAIGAQTGLFDTRKYEVGAFVQDDWKASQKLTLHLGFRWDLLTFPFEVENRQAALNPITGTIDLAGVNGVPQSIINNNFHNFAAEHHRAG